MNYEQIKPLEKRIPAARQEAKRHYGVHPYFTRRPYNVVRDHILHYTQERDIVLDPFGGSGVTAIEAYLANRIGVQNDINPLANFIAEGIVGLSEASDDEIFYAYGKIETACKKILQDIHQKASFEEIPPDIILPPNVRLPRTADVENYHELFTTKQLVSLSILKNEIDRLNGASQKLLLLAWSGALARLNKTFISTHGRAASRGGSSIFSIYRYKIARQPVELDAWSVFESRFIALLAARKEIVSLIELRKRTAGWHGGFYCKSRDVIELQSEYSEKVDYIFTDPPYGGHISYLDLSTLWNVWLGLDPVPEAPEKELIVGGEMGLTEERYKSRLYQSITASFSMLKKDRWLSVVFQHWNIEYFKAILDAARDSGGELRSAISQIGDPIWSMHKKKGKSSVLAGEVILTFYKSGKMCVREPQHPTVSLECLVVELLAETNGNILYGEDLFNRIVVEAWKRGVLDELKITKEDFTHLLENLGWKYDPQKHLWIKGMLIEQQSSISLK
jgi:hypothetical protein